MTLVSNEHFHAPTRTKNRTRSSVPLPTRTPLLLNEKVIVLCRTYRGIRSSRACAGQSPAPVQSPGFRLGRRLTVASPSPTCLNPSLPPEQPARLLAEQALGPHPPQLAWAHQLERAREEWQRQHVALAQVSSPPAPAHLPRPPAGRACSPACSQTRTMAAQLPARWVRAVPAQ